MVLEIFNNESVNSTFEYKFEYKLGGFNAWELVPDITHIAQNILETRLKYCHNIFLKYCKIFHRNITV